MIPGHLLPPKKVEDLQARLSGRGSKLASDVARFVLATRHLGAGEAMAAVRLLSVRMPSLGPIGDEVLFVRAEAALMAGLTSEACRGFGVLVARHPTSPRAPMARFRLADCALLQGRPRQAMAAYDRLLTVYPEYPAAARVRLLAARAALDAGMPTEATTRLRDLVLDAADPVVTAEAKELLAQLSSRGIRPPEMEPEVVLDWAGRLRYWKRWDEAEALLSSLSRIRPPSPDWSTRVALERGLNYLGWGRFAAARAQLRPLLGKVPDRDLVPALKKVMMALGRLDAALELEAKLSNGMELLSASEKTAFDLADYDRAEQLWRRQVELRPRLGRTGRFRWRHAWYQYRKAHLDAAREEFDSLAGMDPSQRSRARYWLARTLARMGRPGEARQVLQDLASQPAPSYYGILARNRLLELDGGLGTGARVFGPVDPVPRRVDGLPSCPGPRHIPGGSDGPHRLPSLEAGSGVARGKARILWDLEGGLPLTRTKVWNPARTCRELFSYLARRYGDLFPGLKRARLFALTRRWDLVRRELQIVIEEASDIRRGGTGAVARTKGALGGPFMDFRTYKKGTWGRRLDPSVLPARIRTTSSARIARIRALGDDFYGSMAEAFIHAGDIHYKRRYEKLTRGFRGTDPHGPLRDDWARAYPLAYEDLVRTAAGELGMSPYLLWGLMTMESLYYPDAVSRADARGLMQIIPKTGNLIARAMGMSTYSAALLFEPEVAVRFAAWYMKELLTKFEGQEFLAVAAYNAGPHNVAAWLDRKGCMPADEFLEEMGFLSARLYARRVLGYVATYRRIYHGYRYLYFPNTMDPRYGSNVNF